jgi:hypothetical protein
LVGSRTCFATRTLRSPWFSSTSCRFSSTRAASRARPVSRELPACKFNDLSGSPPILSPRAARALTRTMRNTRICTRPTPRREVCNRQLLSSPRHSPLPLTHTATQPRRRPGPGRPACSHNTIKIQSPESREIHPARERSPGDALRRRPHAS